MDNKKAVLRLRQHRAARGWSLEDVAEQLHRLARELGEPVPGVDRQAVSRWERGTHRPRPYYVRLLSRLYEASPADLGLVDRPDDIIVGHHPDAALSEEVNRRDFPVHAETALARLAATAALETVADATSRSVYDIDTIKGLIATFRLADNQFGGGYAYGFVTSQLDSLLPVIRPVGWAAVKAANSARRVRSWLISLDGWRTTWAMSRVADITSTPRTSWQRLAEISSSVGRCWPGSAINSCTSTPQTKRSCWLRRHRRRPA